MTTRTQLFNEQIITNTVNNRTNNNNEQSINERNRLIDLLSIRKTTHQHNQISATLVKENDVDISHHHQLETDDHHHLNHHHHQEHQRHLLSIDNGQLIINTYKRKRMFCSKSTQRHIIHLICFFSLLIGFELSAGGIRIWDVHFERDSIDPIQSYGLFWTIILYAFRFLSFLPLPLCFCHAIGLVIYNVFPEKSQLRGSPLLAPFVCIRVVTRGDYPDLVRRNVQRNMNTCLELGMDKFIVEVVTDKPVNLPKNARIRELIVPSTYRTKTGSMYKSRALQYALEDEVNILNDDDWIVHLDEETILTDSSVRGILNFVFEGKYNIGQGLITYANEEVINWVTTLADSFRVGADMGMLRFCLRKFHKALFLFKGSFVVCQAGVERRVTFDNGVEGSIAEDTYFAMSAMSKGYTFDWIDGEMWEKSPFSFWDFLQQRKRWIQGIFLVVHDRKLPLRARFCLALALYSWLTLPLSTSNIYLSALYPIPVGQTFDFLVCFVGAVNLYLYFIGAVKSFSVTRLGYLKFICCVFGALCTIPFVVIIENVAVIWGLFGDKKKFYIVNKSLQQISTASNIV